MDLGAIIGVITGLIVPTIGAVYAYGRLNQKVKDLGDDHKALGADQKELESRVTKVEAYAGDLAGLRQAIDNMGERFSRELEHVNTGFRDLREDLRSLTRGGSRTGRGQ